MKRELKNMSIILNIGSILLFLAGIGIIFTPDVTPIYAFIGSLSIGIFSFFFSFFASKILKVDNSSKLLHYLSIILVLISYIYGEFNNVYCIESMNKIFLASIYLLICILSIFTIIRYKNYTFLHLTFIALILALFHIFNYFSFNYQILFAIIGIVVILFTLFKNDKVKNFAITFSYIYVFLSIILGYTDNFLYSSILFGINMFVIYNALYKDKNVICELVTLLFIIISVIIFGRVVSLHFDFTVASTLIAFVIGILELLVNYYKVVVGKVNKVLYKIGFILMYAVLSILIVRESVSTLLSISIFMLLSSIGSTYLLKSDKDYFIGIKLLVFIFAVLLSVDEYLVNMSDIIYVYIIGIAALFMYLFSNNNIFKVTSLIVSFIILLPLIIMTTSANVIFYLATCLYIILNVLIYIYHDSFIDKSFKSGLLSVYCYVLFAITIPSESAINYLISSVMLLILLIINNQNKARYGVALFFLYFAIKGLINNTVLNYLYVENIRIILNSMLYSIISLLFSLNCFENKSSRNIAISILMGINLSVLMAEYDGLLIILYSLLVSLIMLVIGAINKEYRGVYIIGLVFTIICLLSLLSDLRFSYLRGLPVVIYLIIISIVLITTISIMIIRYNKNPNKTKEDEIKQDEVKEKVEYKNNYCGECGNRIKGTDNYCGECGSNLKGSITYCGNCGRKILKDEKYCESCGNKIK